MPRKQKKYHYIYKTTCLITDKFYVGMHSTDDLDDGYLGSGKILGYSRAKHGDENHKKEILEFVESRETLKLREKEIVNEELLAHPLNINLKYGGDGGCTSDIAKIIWKTTSRKRHHLEMLKRCWADKTYREKQAIASSKNMSANHLAGKIRYDTFSGRLHTEETKKLIGLKNSISQAGNRNSQFGKCWVTNGVKPVSIKKEQLDEYLKSGYRQGRK